MSKIDDALVELRKDYNDTKKQSEFYDLFLNSTFFLPILKDLQAADEGAREVLPVITEAEGKDYLMLFDSLQRLQDWAGDEGKEHFIEVAGHLLALTTTPPLHWALNVGTEFSKQFFPEEIAWLKDAVERCNAEAGKEKECC